MPTLRTLSIASRWLAIAAAAACASPPDGAVSPVANEPAFALRGTACSRTNIALAVGVARRLTDMEAACLNFKSVEGARYLLAYVDTGLVAKATEEAEWPWPDSAIIKVEEVSGTRALLLRIQ